MPNIENEADTESAASRSLPKVATARSKSKEQKGADYVAAALKRRQAEDPALAAKLDAVRHAARSNWRVGQGYTDDGFRIHWIDVEGREGSALFAEEEEDAAYRAREGK